jgi:serine/threonine-protein kinase
MRQPKVAVVVAVSVVMLVAGCHSGKQAGPASTTTTPAKPPVAETALDGFLLSPADVNTAMGATDMTVSGSYKTLVDDSGVVADKACRITAIDADTDSYADSGWTAVREQSLRERDRHSAHYTEQAVVLFPSADKAAAFYTATAQRWPACSNRQFTRTPKGGASQQWAVGPISNSGGTLSNTTTEQGGSGEVCERAVTVADNVAVDVSTCSHTNASGTAVNIAHQIAAKVNK